MLNFKKFLNETPIGDFELLGNWAPDAKRAYGYSKQDIGILTNPKAVEKIRNIWFKNEQEFNFYFVRSKNAYRKVEVGEVDPSYLKDVLKIEIPLKPDSISVVFTQNTGTEKIPMSAWGIAHRFSHAIRRQHIYEQYFRKEVMRDLSEILRNVYGHDASYDYGSLSQKSSKIFQQFAYAIGTMRSARQQNLINFNEFFHELMAQYLITGHIKFNPLPKSFQIDSKKAWGRENATRLYTKTTPTDVSEWNEILQNYTEKYENAISDILQSLLNKVFVM